MSSIPSAILPVRGVPEAMALFLSNEEMWDLPLVGSSDQEEGSRHITHWFGNFAYVLLGFLFKIAFRYRVDGRENLRRFAGKSGVVVIGNHTSFLDVIMLYLSARPTQWIRFMGRETLFQKAGGLLGQILSRVGAFPVKRDTADRTSIKRAAKMLKRGEPVGIFPEGTRRGKGNIPPALHAGAAFIAKMGQAPLMPVTVRNAELVKRKGNPFVHFPKISVEYGTPVALNSFDFLPKDQRLEGCTWYLMRECFALSRRIPACEVDMTELFPETFDYSAVFEQHPIDALPLQEETA